MARLACLASPSMSCLSPRALAEFGEQCTGYVLDVGIPHLRSFFTSTGVPDSHDTALERIGADDRVVSALDLNFTHAFPPLIECYDGFRERPTAQPKIGAPQ